MLCTLASAVLWRGRPKPSRVPSRVRTSSNLGPNLGSNLPALGPPAVMPSVTAAPPAPVLPSPRNACRPARSSAAPAAAATDAKSRPRAGAAAGRCELAVGWPPTDSCASLFSRTCRRLLRPRTEEHAIDPMCMRHAPG
eukprot:scaffold118675_cov39-Phaeocystis_antarctica.AAC.1